MSASFPQMFEPTRRDERRFDLEVQPGWAQGRGTFGGLVLAALVRAMQQCEPESERSLRSVTGELVGPVVPGACEITVELLRRGNAASSRALARLGFRHEGTLRSVAAHGCGRDARVEMEVHGLLPGELV